MLVGFLRWVGKNEVGIVREYGGMCGPGILCCVANGDPWCGDDGEVRA